MNLSFQKDPATETPVMFLFLMIGAIISGLGGSIGGLLFFVVLMALDYWWQMSGNWGMNEDEYGDGVGVKEYYL